MPRPEIPLRCRKCGTDSPDELAVSRSRQHLKDQGRERTHAWVECLACGHAWWSVARAALRLSREADSEAAG